MPRRCRLATKGQASHATPGSPARTHAYPRAQVRSGSQLVSVKRKAGSQLTGAGTGTRVLNKREGYLDMLYIDAAGARLTRGENNLLYLHVREGAALC